MKRGRWTLTQINASVVLLDNGKEEIFANRSLLQDKRVVVEFTGGVPDSIRKATDRMFTDRLGGHKNMVLTGACRELWHGQCGHGVYIQCRCHCHVRKD